MTSSTIKKLNKLNQDFYQKVGPHFSDTRDQAWPGWHRIAELLKKKAPKKLSVLDLGCGNGRFGTYLADILPHTKIEYRGVDNNDTLLEIAKENLTPYIKNLRFYKADIVIAELESSKTDEPPAKTFDLIVAFGLLHHFPSAKLRSKFMNEMLLGLNPGGMLIVTAWQFMKSPRQQQKIVDPKVAGITEPLEFNDYIMSWDSNDEAYRYCHHFDDQEIASLLPKGDYELETYNADGKEGNLNKYLIITKQSDPVTTLF